MKQVPGETGTWYLFHYDVNPDLTTCYRTVRDMSEQLITSLMEIQNAYNELESEEGRKEFFLAVRDRYNEKNLDPLENTTKFFSLITLASTVFIVYVTVIPKKSVKLAV